MIRWALLFFLVVAPAWAQKPPGKKPVASRAITLSSWSVGGRLWQERTYLQQASGQTYKLTDDFYGATLGYQRTTYRKGVSFRHEVYGFLGQVNVSSAESSFNYFEKGLMTVGGGVSETILWTASRATVEYGLGLDVFYRRAIFPEPSPQVTLDNVDRVLFVIGPQVRWGLFGKVFFEQRLGYSPQAQDVVWNFGFVHRGSLW